MPRSFRTGSSEAWQQTAMLLRGEEPGDASVCEECDDLEEAEGMAADDGRIIGMLVAQRDAQGMAGGAIPKKSRSLDVRSDPSEPMK